MGMTAADYKHALQALLPRGAAWRIEPGDDLDLLLEGLAQECARLDTRADALRDEADPRTTFELLTDWERIVLGGVGNPAAPVELRRGNVLARLTYNGDGSVSGLIARALQFGHTITVDQFRPGRCGEMVCGDRLAPEGIMFLLRLNVPVVVSHPFMTGSAVCGDTLGSWDTAALEAEMRRIKPAHTDVVFNYEE